MSSEPYWFRVFAGVFEHRKRIGNAIWVFLWCIARTTKETLAANGLAEGLVLGGQPIPLRTIALDLEMSTDAVYEHLAQLSLSGYIKKIQHGTGRPNGYIVANSKKFVDRRTKARWSETETVVQEPDGLTPPVLQTPAESVVQNPEGTVVQTPGGTLGLLPDTPRAFTGRPSYKSPSVIKEVYIKEKIVKKNSDEPDAISPDIIARAVCDDCGLSGVDLIRTIGDVAKSELKQGKTADQVRSAMTEAWREHSAALADGKLDPEFSPGPDTFFGKGKWRAKTTWKWIEGHKPHPEKSRRYANGASA